MLIGGMARGEGRTASADVFIYNPVTDLVEGARLNEPSYQHACGVVDGKLYVVGAYGPENKGLSSLSWRFTIPERTSGLLALLFKKSRWSCPAAGVGGKLYVMGGRSSFTLNHPQITMIPRQGSGLN